MALGEVWERRELVWLLTSRSIKGRYRQMALGPLWIVIRPLFTVVVFSVIFGSLARLPSDGVPYPIFVYTALIPWSYFSSTASGCMGSLRSQIGLLSKVYYPRLVAPLSAVLSGLVDLGVSLLILAAMLVYYQIPPSFGILALPLFVALAAAVALSIGLWTSAFSVRFRDFAFGVEYGLQAWMYATPVVYAASLVPERWQFVYQLNPMFWVIEGFRWAVLGTGRGPQPTMLLAIGIVLVLLISGAFVFKRAERSIVDLQ